MSTATSPYVVKSAPSTGPDERPMVYPEGSKFVYRASACGNCSRALAAARLGFDPLPTHEMLSRAGDEGRLHEPAVIEYLGRKGWKVTDQQLEINIPLPGAFIRGHIDGMGQYHGSVYEVHGGHLMTEGHYALIEIKTMSRSVFERWDKKQFEDDYFFRYATQASLYMFATNRPLLLVAKRRDDGLVKEFYFPTPPIAPAAVIKRLTQVEFLARKGEMPLCDRNDFFCSYKYLCNKGPQTEEGPQEIPNINEVAFTAWAKKYVEASQMKEQYEELQKTARSQLLNIAGYVPSNLDKNEARVTGLKYSAGKYSISIFESDRESVSLSKMREVFGEAVEPYVSTSRYPSLRVKEL